MDSCDILIVGGGPAGSSCAWGLRGAGLDVVILDKQVFPRDKICGGWITPGVLTALGIDTRDYVRGRTLQPISAFRTGRIGDYCTQFTDYGAPVSYGIRRREFDDHLLRRCGARVCEGTGLARLERTGEGWIANSKLRARIVVGAGGHFCPVARQFSVEGRSRDAEAPVVAQETEFALDANQAAACPVRGNVPELYFCADMKGYGWCFRKGDILNIGLGRADPHALPEHVAQFVRFLIHARGFAFRVPAPHGHAYLLQGTSPRPVFGDQFLLVGDAAGLAYSQSGEGILPAIESGLMAAETILAASGDYGAERLERYAGLLQQRFGGPADDLASSIGRHLPEPMVRLATAGLLRSGWFVRSFVLDRWFLHGQRALE